MPHHCRRKRKYHSNPRAAAVATAPPISLVRVFNRFQARGTFCMRSGHVSTALVKLKFIKKIHNSNAGVRGSG